VAGEFGISQHLGGAYIISEPMLRRCLRLVENLSGKDGPVTLSITFQGGRSLEGNPDTVLSDSLVQSRPIRDITIRQLIASEQVYVNFSRYGQIPIYFKAEGNKVAIVNFERELLNEIAGCKQLYSPLSHRLTMATLTGVVGGSFFSQLVVNLAGNRNPFLEKLLPALAFVLLILIICLVAFPPLIFDLGQGAQRHKVRTAILSFLAVTVIGGITVNVSYDWLKDYFTPHAKEVDKEKSAALAEPSVSVAPPVSPVLAPPAAAASQRVETTVSVPIQHVPLTGDLKEQTNQDIRQSAYVLQQELTEFERQYYRDQTNLGGSADHIALGKLELDEKLNRDFRQQYEPDVLKLDLELARRLNISNDEFTSFAAGRIGIGVIYGAADHLIRLANRLP